MNLKVSRMFVVGSAVLLFAAAGAGSSFSETHVNYESGEIELAAALLIPRGRGPFPAVVILQGSGDSDRTNLWSRSWAEMLAGNGVAALLTDKRGCGLSGGDWKMAGFRELAEDAIAGVEFLRSRSEVDSRRIGLVGLSQGGHVAPLAGTLSDHVAFVVDISGSATTPVEQVNHEMRNTFRQAGLDEKGVEAGMRLQELAEQFVRTGDWESYETALKEAAASPLAPVAEGFPQARDSWVWGWWRRVADFDPIDHWKSLEVPMLVFYGRDDEMDNVPVAESVRRFEEIQSGRDLTIRVFDGSGHALWHPDTENHRYEVRPDAARLLVEWIESRTE